MRVDDLLPELELLYGDQAPAVTERLLEMAERYVDIMPKGGVWNERDSLLITYGDSIRDPGDQRTPLASLEAVLRERVGDAISYVHILPCFPYTSDDGFSVVDYRQIDPNLGGWSDVERIAEHYRLVLDAVVNHVSQESAYVRGFLAGDERYADFCIEMDPATDLRSVTRPRLSPLLHAFPDHADRERHLWTTFSRDQVDLNFANPEVLIEISEVLLSYAAHGAEMIRLDAIAFLWKRIGTTCLHLPETYAVVRLWRKLFDRYCPHCLLLTETNVPHAENVSYFGRPGHAGEAAQIVYNFTLAPLVLSTMLTGESAAFNSWAKSVEAPGDGVTFLNITATHDGIGMRPSEGILSEEQRQLLIDRVEQHGGTVSFKDNGDGTRTPYELNITYYDACNDPAADEDESLQVARFLAGQAIALSFLGLPAIYVHSLFASRNDVEGWQRSGIPRRINRSHLLADALATELDNPDHRRSRVFHGFMQLLRVRQSLPAFHPEARQRIHVLHAHAVVIERSEGANSVLAVINVSVRAIDLPLPESWQGRLVDRLENDSEVSGAEVISWPLAPYQVAWLQRC